MTVLNPQKTADEKLGNAPVEPKSIFAMTFEKQKRGQEEMKRKYMKKGTIFLSIALILLIPYSILFLYPQTKSYLSFNTKYNAIQNQISEAEIKIADLKTERESHKAAYDEVSKEEQKIISTVFPDATEKLEVVRLMEDYATFLSSKYGDFEFTSISFQEPVKQKGYTALPFQTSIHASQNNFDRFLGLIDISGNIDPDSPDHIRLMEISNISLNYRGLDNTGKDQGVDFTVELIAYSV